MEQLRTDNPYANAADPMLEPLKNPYTDIKQVERIIKAWNKKNDPRKGRS